ncbi:hypothetical protein [Amycolatopsis benzoatilytica]|uniref:hypothetical protein n=1 Tax=Amycolatopsis benzoatilytica TaxID=346045 RepID=UPI00039FF057|nr:hypothetical protein [Amycolatopsis benzoatilytica]
MLRDDNEDAVLACNATPALQAVAVLTRRPLSMPYTDFVVETISGQVPENYRPTDNGTSSDDSDFVTDPSAAGPSPP